MEGYIDRETNLPVVELTINQHRVLCMVDTGYNGFLWTGIDIAMQTFGMQIDRVDGMSQLADGSGGDFQLEPVEIVWFDQIIRRRIQVSFGLRGSKFPVVLGTALLIGYVLIVDFNHGLVQIRDPRVSRVSP